MVLEEYRKQADPYLNPIAAYFVSTHPNTMTWLAFVFAVLAGLTFIATNFLGAYSTYALFLAAALIFLNAGFDALDGKVARLSRRESKRGDFLDHVLDRYADFFIIGGMTVSPFCDPWIGVLAILGVIFASYMGTQAQAVGIKRDYGGLLGRSDRLVLLIFLPLIQMFLELSKLIGPSHHFPVTLSGVTIRLSVIELMMIWFAIAGNTTAIQRAWATWKELSKSERGTGEPGSRGTGDGTTGPTEREKEPNARKEELNALQSELLKLQDHLVAKTNELDERDKVLTKRATDLAGAVRKLGADRDALEAERRTGGKSVGPGVEAPAPGPTSIEDAENRIDQGVLNLTEATAQLRSARMAIEQDMRNLKEKEIRLMKLERRIEKRQMEARRK
jgi:archaetidylinositol phosphate synthase